MFARRVTSILVSLMILCCGCGQENVISDQDNSSISNSHNQFYGVRGKSLTEVKYGNRIYLKMRSAGLISNDVRLIKYMAALRKRLIVYAERDSLPYVISVTNDARIYAASTPGGYIYISLGMLDFVKTESELVMVIAHEIAQTQYKQQKFKLSKLFFGFGRSLVGLVSFVFPFAAGVTNGLKIVDTFVLKDISLQGAVLRGDKLGIEYLMKAGYRKEALIELMEHCTRYDYRDYSRLKTYLVTRPFTEKRIEAIKELVPEPDYDSHLYAQEQASYANVKRYVENLLMLVQ